ncbi:hypothetical protein D7Z94_22715 [Ulvibacterium marinum]|uniref:Uncharacterized protein n=1 Tax=Ulvibacterium marinum TaxID=2419782 RepID=A0A3B0BX16_9FLAO|nr:hypothetical protein D7Z94_22715 [Ulvibacterium marinum]
MIVPDYYSVLVKESFLEIPKFRVFCFNVFRTRIKAKGNPERYPPRYKKAPAFCQGSLFPSFRK